MTSSPHRPITARLATTNSQNAPSINIDMATEPTEKKRRTCSICLEAFRGRQPKLLSCFHTFCSPCLSQLVDREARKKAQVLSGTEGDSKDVPVTLTCPTCRTCVPVPAGGVSQLQANVCFEEEAAGDALFLPCDLCEDGQKAAFQCANCINNFCNHCLDFHNQLCKSPAASLITDSTGSAGTQSVGKESQDLAQSMEDVLKKVAEEEKKLALERRATEQDIHERYRTIMRHAAEAQDSGLTSLRDVTQAVSESLTNASLRAREVLSSAKDQTSERHPSPSNEIVLTKSTRRHFEELLKKADDEALLTYTISDDVTHAMLRSVTDFMSTVVAAGSNADSGVADGDNPSGSFPPIGITEPQNADFTESDNQKINELTTQLQDLSARFTQNEKVTSGLRAQNALLFKVLMVVQDANTKLSNDFAALQKEMTSLTDELTSQGGVFSGAKNNSSVTGQDNQRHRNHLSSLQSDHDQVLTKQTTMQGEVDQLQVDQNKLKTDQDTLTSEVQTLKTDVGQLDDLCQKNKAAIAGLEARLNKVNAHVAFHARLGVSTVSVAKFQTIVCDNVISNIGDGYNGETGVFTAPVSGTYCFMATCTPGSEDTTTRAALFIVVGQEDITYLSAWGKGWSTGHCVAYVRAGQTVRLRSCPGTGGERKAPWVWLTSFTGTLLQADL